MPGRRSTASHDAPLPTPPPAPAHEVVVSRIIDAPRDLVFFAFTRSAYLRHWLGPAATLDFPERIVCGEPVGDSASLNVTFVAHAGRTTVVLRHTACPAVAEAGWVDALERLAAELEAA